MSSTETREWVVLKFGGTSVSSAAGWKSIANRAKELLQKHRVWIVISALSGVSTKLEKCMHQAVEGGKTATSLQAIYEQHLALAKSIGIPDSALAPLDKEFQRLGNLLDGIGMTQIVAPELQARVMSFGEKLSTTLGVALLNTHGLTPNLLDASQILQSTVSFEELGHETIYLAAHVSCESLKRLRPAADTLAGDANLVLTQGFIARTPKNKVCLLGRGGSDTSGSLFAALLGAHLYEVWTDVDGMFTADPNRVSNARLIRSINYKEAQELATLGAKVLHPRCLEPAAYAHIPVVIRNTFNFDAKEHTKISLGCSTSSPVVLAVAKQQGVTLVSFTSLEMWRESGFLVKFFSPFQRFGVSVDLIATSESNITVTLDDIPGGVDGDIFSALVACLKELGGNVNIVHPCSTVSVVGRHIRKVMHELGPALTALRELDVYLFSQSSEDTNLSFVVKEADGSHLLESLHKILFSQRGKSALFGATADAIKRGSFSEPAVKEHSWIVQRKETLLAQAAAERGPRLLCDLGVLQNQIRAVSSNFPMAHHLFCSVSANQHPEILRTLQKEGLWFSCRTAREIASVRQALGDSADVFFCPGMCALAEFQTAFESNATVIVDCVDVLSEAGEVFRDRSIGVQIDLDPNSSDLLPGGVSLEELPSFLETAKSLGVKVAGLVVNRTENGPSVDEWGVSLTSAMELCSGEPLKWIFVGGQLDVGSSANHGRSLQSALQVVRDNLGSLELYLDPGRDVMRTVYVLLCPITQVRVKGSVTYLGVEACLTSTPKRRVAVSNLSKANAESNQFYHIVGSDGVVLVLECILPPTSQDDVLAFTNIGAESSGLEVHILEP